MTASYPSIAEQVGSVPDAPGVYLWKNAAGEVLYVGKAKSLKKRMRQYTSGQDERDKIPLMMEQVTGFDYVVTCNEVESLILEKNLIRQFHPPYNVDYRDDKSYPFIALTLDDPYPAIKYTREKHKPGTRYFGPYTDSRAARETVDTVRRIVPICRATCAEWKRVTARDGAPAGRPCFDHHVGIGPGPCVGAIGREEYAVNVARVARFLTGKHDDLEGELGRQMRAAADNLDYEGAARHRNRLEAVQAIRERQTAQHGRGGLLPGRDRHRRARLRRPRGACALRQRVRARQGPRRADAQAGRGVLVALLRRRDRHPQGTRVA
jgi:excinuclease ABC subunit C